MDQHLDEAIAAVLQLARERKSAESLAQVRELLAACSAGDREAVEGCKAFVEWRAATTDGQPIADGLTEAVAGIARLRQAGSPRLLGWACSTIGSALGLVGDFEAGLEWLESAIEDALGREDRRLLVSSYMQKGGLLLFADEADRAFAIFAQARDLCEGDLKVIRAGTLSDMAYCQILRARRWSTPDPDRAELARQALQYATEALAATDSPEYALWECEALSNQGAALNMLGRLAEAEATFKRGLLCAKASSRVHVELMAGYAELLIGGGRYAPAAELLAQAAAHVPSALIDPTTDRVLELQIELARRTGRGEEAHALWERRLRNVQERYRDRLRNVWRHAEIFAELKQTRIAEQQARTQATTDHLTGVSTRLHFEERAEGEIQRARRYGRPMSLVLFDLDHFKAINDRFGHGAGDRVLVDVTRRVRQNLRESDVLARWGGEEFAVLLPESDADEAMKAAEKFRALLTGGPIAGVGTVTSSFGVALLAADESLEGLLARADRALYAAKAAGRNTVRLAG